MDGIGPPKGDVTVAWIQAHLPTSGGFAAHRPYLRLFPRASCTSSADE
jgi:hypothetical protein